MRVHLHVLLLTVFATPSQDEAARPTAVYTIHTKEIPRRQSGFASGRTTAAVTPKGALLVLLPQTDGQWALKQLSDWETVKPREQTITFAAQQPDGQTNVYGKIAITPDNRYAFVFVTAVHLKVSFDDPHRLESTVLVVDLRDFSTISRSTTTDRLLQGDLRFNKEGVLVSFGVSTLSSNSGKSRSYLLEAGTLSVPALSHEQPCYYSSVVGIEPTTRKMSQTFHDERGDCLGQLKAASVSSIGELRDLLYTSPTPLIAQMPYCQIATVSQDGKFVLESCGKEHLTGGDGMFSFTTSNAIKIVSTSSGKAVLTLRLPFHEGPHVDFLAYVDGNNYLVRLSDDAKVEAYLIPQP